MPRRLIALALLAALAACSKSDNEPGPGGVSVGEARALDEAAQMIEGQSLPAAPPPAEVAPQGQAAPAPTKPAAAAK